MIKIAVALMRMMKLVVRVTWSVVVAVVRLLMATLWVIASALVGSCIIAISVIPRLVMLRMTLVVESWLL